MLSIKAREAADTIFEVFGMTQLRIEHSLPKIQSCLKPKYSNHISSPRQVTENIGIV